MLHSVRYKSVTWYTCPKPTPLPRILPEIPAPRAQPNSPGSWTDLGTALLLACRGITMPHAGGWTCSSFHLLSVLEECMKKLVLICLVLLIRGALALAKKYPSRDITNIVVWGAGARHRRLQHASSSAEMAAILGVKHQRGQQARRRGGFPGHGRGLRHEARRLHHLRPVRVLRHGWRAGGWDKKKDVLLSLHRGRVP